VLAFIGIVICLFLVVGLHELGHVLAAHFFNVKIKKVSIGFGPALLARQSQSGCRWQWALWPLGGYAELLNTRIAPVALHDEAFAFDKKPIWQRCIILFAGVLMNMMVAWLALTLLNTMGFTQQLPVIAKVERSSIAATAGILACSRIVRTTDGPVFSWEDVGGALLKSLNKHNLGLVLQTKQGTLYQVTLPLASGYFDRQTSLLQSLGIKADSHPHPMQIPAKSLAVSASLAFWHLLNLLSIFILTLKLLVTGVLSFSVLLGPLGFFTEVANSFSQGFTVFLNFIAEFSLLVALVNLLPIPGLDGASIVYALLEKIRGRPLSVGLEILLYRLVTIAFAIFLVRLLLNDAGRILMNAGG
jgi:regulator of sigma E protease